MKRAGDILTKIFDEEFMHKAGGYSALFSCWKDLTEKNGIPSAAGHSSIKSIEKGIVWIEVDHPGWNQILQTKQGKLLYDFRRRFPEMEISGISIMLSKPGSPVYTPPGNEPDTAVGINAAGIDAAVNGAGIYGAPEIPPPPALDVHNGSSGYDAIEDEALREILKNLEKKISKRKSVK